jgi:hypothetical protein
MIIGRVVNGGAFTAVAFGRAFGTKISCLESIGVQVMIEMRG